MCGMSRLRFVLTVLALAVLVPATALAGAARDGAAARGAAALPGLMTGRGPWGPNNGALLQVRLGALGLPALSAEGAALHLHQHIDLFVRGVGVQLPPGIGIDAQSRFIAELHTHDGSGVVHVEAPRLRPFTLGQFFDVWGLRFSERCLGGHCAGKGTALRVWVNGERWKGDPRRIVLRQHDEYVIAFGTVRELPRAIAASFPFPPGL